MKLTSFFLLAACLQVSARGYTQKVTLSAKDMPLDKVFSVIEHQTGYAFFYDFDIFKGSRNVTLTVKDMDLPEVLKICLKDQPLDFQITNTTVSIVKKKATIQDPFLPPRPPFEFQGIVLDENSQPLSGATIKLKNGKIVAITDQNGSFRLKNISDDAVFVVSYTGYTSMELPVNKQASLNISLRRATNKLDEVQVIAYGTSTQRLATGNVSKVTSKEIEQQPVSNALAALEGRVPGLVITQSTGVPGGGFAIQLRGLNSIANANQLFYVVDGVPYNSQIPALPLSSALLNGSLHDGNPFNYINPYDIESIEVLKDADATAIYGSRAANGAILITTKKGKSGRMKIDLNMNSGFQAPARDIKLLNTPQYLATRHEAFNNDGTTPQDADYDVNGFWDTTRYTDWSKVLTNKTAHYNNALASVYGGNSNTQYLFGVGYNRQSTSFPILISGDGIDQKVSTHFNLSTQSEDKRFRLAFTGSYVSNRNTVQSEDFSNDRLGLAPDAPILFNPDRSLNWMPTGPGQLGSWTNPYSLLYIKYKQNTSNLVGNAIVSYTILPNWEIKSSFGYTMTRTDEVQAFPTQVYDPGNHITSGHASFNSINSSGWIIEPQTNYKLHLSRGLLTVLLGSTFQQNNSAIQGIYAEGFASNALIEGPNAASYISINNSGNTYKYDAVFGRLNYNWEDKYLLNLTGRRDGSSRFGPGKQFGNFGAIGGAWIFSREVFINKNVPFLSFGKLRVSYGTTGNDGIGDYQFKDLYNTTYVPYGSLQGLYPMNLSNPFLAWETTRKLEASISLGVLKDRILLEASYYRNRSNNQLVATPVSLVTGFPSIPSNRPALVENKGMEFTVNSLNIKCKNFTWSSSFNLTLARNKLLAFPDLANSSYSYLKIGQPINIIPLYRMIGINDSAGLYQFSDNKGTPTYYPNFQTDRTVFVNTAPKFYGGLKNSFTYKDISLDIFFQFVKQTGQNLFGSYSAMPGMMANIPVAFLNRWQKRGDKAVYQKFSQDVASDAYNSFNYAQQSDFAYSDASFIRLKNLSISWQLPKEFIQKLHVESCRIYLQGQNLLTITRYNGIDPESQGTGLPPMRVYTAGFQVTL